MAKLKIDIAHGIIEVEGEESLVKLVYSEFRDKLQWNPSKQETPQTAASNAQPKTTKERASPSSKSTSASKKRSSGGSASGTFVKDLDLSGGGNNLRLKDFHAQYLVTSNLERNLIFAYYLQHKLGLSDITLNHVFTCYREVGVKVPGALLQSLRDTANRRGWLDTSITDDLKVTVTGMNYLEHDLKKGPAE